MCVHGFRICLPGIFLMSAWCLPSVWLLLGVCLGLLGSCLVFACLCLLSAWCLLGVCRDLLVVSILASVSTPPRGKKGMGMR